MLRSLTTRTFSVVRAVAKTGVKKNIPAVTTIRHGSHGPQPTPAEYENNAMNVLSSPNLTGQSLRSVLMTLNDQDMVPDAPVVIEVMKACRRLNDYALAVRFLEAIRDKCGYDKAVIAYMNQEVGPTLKELGISNVDEMGYDKPELAVQDVWQMH